MMTVAVDEFFVITAPARDGFRGLEEWRRSAAIDVDGDVLLPAAIAGNESAVAFRAMMDDEPCHSFLRHLFVSARWLAKAFPTAAASYEKIAECVRDMAELSGQRSPPR
jgi:hypothetical protein